MQVALIAISVLVLLAMTAKNAGAEPDPKRGGNESAAPAAWGVPRVPNAHRLAAETAKRSGWFKLRSKETPAQYMQLVRESWEVLIGSKDPAVWANVHERDVAGPHTGSLRNAPTWADVDRLRAEYQDCISGVCSANVRDARRKRFYDALDAWRRAGLNLIVKSNLQNEPGPG